MGQMKTMLKDRSSPNILEGWSKKAGLSDWIGDKTKRVASRHPIAMTEAGRERRECCCTGRMCSFSGIEKTVTP